MTAVRTIWKKLVSLVVPVVSGALVLITAACHHEAHRARHAAPAPPKAKPQDEDARTIAWLARLHEVPARVMAAPFIIAGTWLAAFAAVMPRTAAPAGAPAPGSNDARTSVGVGNPVGNSVPWADVDQYLTDDALRHGFNFEAEHPVLPGEHHPPWPRPFVDGHDIGPGFVVEPTLPPLPEPAADWKPHACGDVDQPTAILRPLIPPTFTEAGLTDLRERFYASLGKPPVILSERCTDPPEESCSDAGCPVHGYYELIEMCPEGCGCRLDGEDADRRECGCDGPCTEDEPPETDDEFIASVAPFLPPEATADPAYLPPSGHVVMVNGHASTVITCPACGEPAWLSGGRISAHDRDMGGFDDPCFASGAAPQDVPGPAESASPAPPGGAEAATPPAVVAGPGTPDDTAADLPAVAARAFIDDMLSHQASPEADWLDRLFDAAFVKAQAVREASR